MFVTAARSSLIALPCAKRSHGGLRGGDVIKHEGYVLAAARPECDHGHSQTEAANCAFNWKQSGPECGVSAGISVLPCSRHVVGEGGTLGISILIRESHRRVRLNAILSAPHGWDPT